MPCGKFTNRRGTSTGVLGLIQRLTLVGIMFVLKNGMACNVSLRNNLEVYGFDVRDLK
jgi:hypothetical protein